MNEGGWTRRASPAKQRGAIAVLVALMLVVLMGFTSLAVDLAFGLVVRNELQNAADAAALAGAGWLYRDGAAPNWIVATDAASAAIALNQSSHVTLGDGDVQPGYWNVASGSSALQVLPAVAGAGDAAAVQVTISRAAGQNGGAVPTFFANVLGIGSMPVTATAIAAVTAPNRVGTGGVFPLAMSGCLYRAYWDATATPPAPKTDPGTGLPYVFRIGGAETYSTCVPGAWSTFENDTNSPASLSAFVADRNTAPLSVGANVWIQPNVDSSVFGLVDTCSAQGNRSCETVIVPIVENVGGHAQAAVVAFACLRVELASTGSDNFVQASMRGNCIAANAGGAGPVFGAFATPRLTR